jgi:hypothetical protein
MEGLDHRDFAGCVLFNHGHAVHADAVLPRKLLNSIYPTMSNVIFPRVHSKECNSIALDLFEIPDSLNEC